MATNIQYVTKIGRVVILATIRYIISQGISNQNHARLKLTVWEKSSNDVLKNSSCRDLGKLLGNLH